MKKILAIILSLLLIFSFSACSKEQTNADSSSEILSVHNGWYTEGEISITKSEVEKIVNSEFTTPKNVILIIGDGMGPNDITLAEKYGQGVYDFGLVLNQIKNTGFSTTHSASDEITDSAASATALATGVKTNNGTIGLDPSGKELKNVLEIARENGKKVGIVTNDCITGATPSAFTLHNASRNNVKELTNAMIKFKPDVLMCEDYTGVFAPLEDEARQIFNNEYLVADKFKRFKETLDTDKDNTKPFIGIIEKYSSVSSYNLAQGVEVALERLKNDNGFFVMIEGCGTDKNGQNNNMQGKLNSVVTLDRAVAAALKFMEKNPDTLLIVTSDHDTGGVRLPKSEGESLSNLLTTNEHTATPVRTFAVGKGSEYFSGKTIDNTDIGKFIIKTIKGE